MATLRTVYVDPDVSGGSGNGTSWANAYSSLNAAEQAEDNTGDLVARDEYIEFHCGHNGASQTTADTTAVTIDGWTTDATRYIAVLTETADRHSGVWSDAKYRLYVSDSYAALSIQEAYVRVTGLQIRKGNVTTNGQCCVVGGGTDTRISTTLCRQYGGTTYYETGFFCSNTGATWTIWNTIVAGLGDNANGYCSACIVFAGTVNLYNCTLIGGANAIKIDSGKTCNAKNVYGRGSVDGFKIDGTLNQTTCATSDASAAGTGLDNVPYSTTTFESVTPWDGSYLKVKSTGALYGAGTTLTDDPPGSTALSVDIAGNARS